METDDDKKQVSLAGSHGVLSGGCSVQPHLHLGASTSKHTDNGMNLILNTSLHLSVRHPFIDHSEYSSESEDTEESFDDEETDEKLTSCNNLFNSVAVRDETSTSDLNQKGAKIFSEVACFDGNKDTEIHFDEGTGRQYDSRVIKHTQQEPCTGVNQNCETFFRDVRHLHTDEIIQVDLSHNFEGGSCDSVSERLRMITVCKTIDASNKLILRLSALETYLTVQLAKVRQKLSSAKTIKSILLGDKHSLSAHKTHNMGLQSCFPYFKHPRDKSECPVNEDSLTKSTHSELVISDFSAFSHWSPGDKMQLKKAVQCEMRMRHVRSQIPTVRSVCCSLKNEAKVLETDTLEEHEWEDIAKEIQGKHSGAECRGMWINHIQPSLQCKPFTKEEENRLREIAEYYGKQDWNAIAAALDTGHSALQCYILYKNTCTVNRKKHWSGEENERLQGQLIKHQIGKTVDWKRVTFHMQKQLKGISEHWKYVANPNIKKGKFTQRESSQLIKGVRMFGPYFSKIARYFLPKRTSKQLRNHYKTLVSTSRMGNWSKEEDMELLHLVEKYDTPNWPEICKHFIDPMRTRSQVRGRYLTLKRWISKNVPFHKLNTRNLITAMEERSRKLSLAKNGTLRALAPTRHRKKQNKESNIDINIKKFLHVNFVDGRTEWSLEKSFILAQEDVEKRAYDIKQLLPLLNAKVTISNATLMTDVSISNHDKMVFYHLQKEFSDKAAIVPLSCSSPPRSSVPVLDAGPNVPILEDTQMITTLEETQLSCNSTFSTPSSSSLRSIVSPTVARQSYKIISTSSEESVTGNMYSECSFSACRTVNQDLITTPPSPCEADATSLTEHSDFLVPSVTILDTLIDVLLDKDLDECPAGCVEPYSDLEEDIGLCIESFTLADDLFMERLKTIFLCPLLLTTKNVELAENSFDIDTATSTGYLRSNEEEACTSGDVSPREKKRGRPRKEKKRTTSGEEAPLQPKRKYIRTGKYSKSNNITPRVNLRKSCRNTESTPELQQQND